MSVNRLTTVAVLTALVGVTNCQKGSWMKDMSDAEADYNYDLFDDTIFDIIWPGSADPGMYESVIDTDATVSNSPTPSIMFMFCLICLSTNNHTTKQHSQ